MHWKKKSSMGKWQFFCVQFSVKYVLDEIYMDVLFVFPSNFQYPTNKMLKTFALIENHFWQLAIEE